MTSAGSARFTIIGGIENCGVGPFLDFTVAAARIVPLGMDRRCVRKLKP